MQEQAGIDFWRYVGILKRWMWLLIVATVVGAGVAYGVSRSQTPVYQAEMTLLINQAPGTLTTSSSTDYNSLLTSKSLATTYAQLLTERKVLEGVIPLLPVTMTVEQLKNDVAVSVVRDTQLIQVTVENTDLALAAQIANTLSKVFIDQISDMQSERYRANKDSLSTQISEMDRQIQEIQKEQNALGGTSADLATRERLETILSQYRQSYANLLQTYEQIRFAEAQTSSNVAQVEAAVAPTLPIRPKIPTNTLLGGVVGLLVALGVVFLVESLDDTLKHTSQITGTGPGALPVLGFVPFFDTSDDQLPLVASQPRSPIAERFRALRTNIQFSSVDHPLHTILVTSPAPGDGKTTVAANLAVALAQSGLQVALVDADLRRPTLHKKLNVANGAGMSSMFVQPRIHLNGNLQSTGLPGLDVLTSGSTPPNPAELLGSAKMQEVLRLVQEQRELIILDSPPVTSVTDAVVLSSRVDGVLLVVRPGQTRVGACREAIAELQRAGANILGIVLNGVKAEEARYYSGYYHYYYYHYYYENDKPLTGFAKFKATLSKRFGLKHRRRHHRSKSTTAANGVNVDAWLEPEQAMQEHQEESEH